jgi:hypothetical protein
MPGVMHRFHGHAQSAQWQPASPLLTAVVTLLVILAILVLLLGVLAARAS